jgi:hypothetical protein
VSNFSFTGCNFVGDCTAASQGPPC